jgi:hypothetical protein
VQLSATLTALGATPLLAPWRLTRCLLRRPHRTACARALLQEPSDDENDMLDLAFGLTETSRLGCQVIASKELDGLVVRLPSVRC